MRAAALVVVVFGLLSLALGPAHAQRTHTQAELDALLAPIALQPDPLLSHILIAATYPDEIAEAAHWSREHPGMKGDEAVRAVEDQPWHPSVKALVAFPELLERMDESPQWTRDLGEAFLAQQPHVMETIQQLRRRAQASGYLRADEHYRVQHEGGAIAVLPAYSHVVYLRYYDPWIVYGPWWWPHYRPVHWRPWHGHFVHVTSGFFFASFDWPRRHVIVHQPAVRVPKHAKRAHPPHHLRHDFGHRRGVISTPHQRIPESQRRPIIQSTPSFDQRHAPRHGFEPRHAPRHGFEPRHAPRHGQMKPLNQGTQPLFGSQPRHRHRGRS
jgi:hypothetical protein